MRFVRIELSPTVDNADEPKIHIHAVVDTDDTLAGKYPSLGTWGPSTEGEFCPFELRGSAVDFGSGYDDGNFRYATLDMEDHAVQVNQLLSWHSGAYGIKRFRISQIIPLG
jgi:hypothetical protein